MQDITIVRYIEVRATKQGWQGRVKRLVNLGYRDSLTASDKPEARNGFVSLRRVIRPD